MIVRIGASTGRRCAAPTGSSVTAGGTASVQNVGSGVIAVNDIPQAPAQVTDLNLSRIIPPDNALPLPGNAPAAPPKGGGGPEIQLAAESAGDALDQGFAVEIDLTPGPKKRK